jgi:DnaK suppressor protein
MDAKQLKMLEKRLLEKREQLFNDIGRMKADEVIRIPSKDPEEFDYEVEITRGLIETEEREIQEIDRALARIEGKTFGICESCGKEIKPSRIKALPSARQCLPCKIKEEEA